MGSRSGAAVAVQKGRLVQEPDRSRDTARAWDQEHEQDLSKHVAGGQRLEKLHAGQHAMAERICLHVAAFAELRCTTAEERFSKAARHDLFARADIHGELDVGNIQPGRYSAGIVKLHRLSRQRCELSNASVEAEAWFYQLQLIRFHYHRGEGAVGETRAVIWRH